MCRTQLTGSSGNIVASFARAGISDTEPFTTGVACTVVTCNPGQLGGTVFEDFNADGIKQAGEYSG